MRARAILLSALCGAACACAAGERTEEVPVVVVAKQAFARTVEADGTLRPVRATPLLMPAEAPWLARITWLAPDGAAAKKGAELARLDELELKQDLANARDDHAVSTALRSKQAILLSAEGRDRRRDIESSERDLALTRAFPRKDSDLFSRDQIIESEIDAKLQESRLDTARRSEPAALQVGRGNVAVHDVDVKRYDEAIRRAESGLRALSITAPHDGIFTLRRHPWRDEPIRVGDTVSRGMAIGEVAVLDEMEAQVFVLEVEAAGLAEGRPAEVTLESQPGRRFPARVRRVETVTRRRQQASPTQYFGVTLGLDETLPALMKPGQRVRARLFLSERPDALVVPRPALFERDGRTVVYRRDDRGGFAPVAVTVGPATAGLVSIEGGLRPGDRVALREPGQARAGRTP